MRKACHRGAAVFALLFACSGGARADELTLMTGPQGGLWLPLGGALKTLWEAALPGTTIQILPGAGISNLRAIQAGKAQLGFGNSITSADAVAGRAPFKAAHGDICNVATLYPQYFQIVVRAESGIAGPGDLAGRSLTTQVRGSTGELITRQLLGAAGLSYRSVKVRFAPFNDSVAAMLEGRAEAFALGAVAPAAPVVEIAASRAVRLLDLAGQYEAMHKINPGYALVTVKAGTYAKQEQDVRVIGYATHLVASCKLAPETVYAIAKVMAAQMKGLAAINKALADLTPAAMAADIGVPLHPGAARFYRECGALK